MERPIYIFGLEHKVNLIFYLFDLNLFSRELNMFFIFSFKLVQFLKVFLSGLWFPQRLLNWAPFQQEQFCICGHLLIEIGSQKPMTFFLSFFSYWFIYLFVVYFSLLLILFLLKYSCFTIVYQYQVYSVVIQQFKGLYSIKSYYKIMAIISCAVQYNLVYVSYTQYQQFVSLNPIPLSSFSLLSMLLAMGLS